MKITDNNRTIWMNFFKAAGNFRDLAPWEWMHDSDIFGVKDPVSGEISWCCIMGAAREVYALGVYPGTKGYTTYLNLLNLHDESEKTDHIAAGLGQYVHKIEFVNRDETDETDRKAFKELGLKFHGDHKWIQAREMKPGYYPYYLSDKQAVSLTHVLQQAIEVAQRFRTDDSLLEDENENMLVRVPAQTEQGLVWKDEYLPEPEPEEMYKREISPFLVNRALRELQKKEAAICFSLSYMPGGIKKGPGENRPYFAKIALWIGYGSAYILGTHLFSPKEFENNFDEKFFQQLHALKIIPRQIIVNSDFAYDAVEPIAKALDIELIYAPEVPDFKEVEEGFMRPFLNRF